MPRSPTSERTACAVAAADAPVDVDTATVVVSTWLSSRVRRCVSSLPAMTERRPTRFFITLYQKGAPRLSIRAERITPSRFTFGGHGAPTAHPPGIGCG